MLYQKADNYQNATDCGLLSDGIGWFQNATLNVIGK